jgi:hypothetical protein
VVRSSQQLLEYRLVPANTLRSKIRTATSEEKLLAA